MGFKRLTEENINIMVSKGIDINTGEFQPDEFSEYSFICVSLLAFDMES